jgi:hypothetical protein
VWNPGLGQPHLLLLLLLRPLLKLVELLLCLSTGTEGGEAHESAVCID